MSLKVNFTKNFVWFTQFKSSVAKKTSRKLEEGNDLSETILVKPTVRVLAINEYAQ